MFSVSVAQFYECMRIYVMCLLNRSFLSALYNYTTLPCASSSSLSCLVEQEFIIGLAAKVQPISLVFLNLLTLTFRQFLKTL